MDVPKEAFSYSKDMSRFLVVVDIWLGVFTAFTTPIVVYIFRYFYGKAKEINYAMIREKACSLPAHLRFWEECRK